MFLGVTIDLKIPNWLVVQCAHLENDGVRQWEG
jgi:hypothetical protein